MDTNWQITYYVSQIILVVIAASAVVFARLQLDASKLFELIKFANERKFRAARTIVIHRIEPVKDKIWWVDDKSGELESAASEVCVCYNILGLLFESDGYDIFGLNIKKRWRIILLHLAPSIVRCHSSLSGFLAYRRSSVPTAYAGFSKLEAAAKGYAPIINERTEH